METALILGASRGLGRGIAAVLLARGSAISSSPPAARGTHFSNHRGLRIPW
jgi:NAD(P)-dependent dehydrogenase (short-subunit alcohol dehydrogenase family)